VKSLSKASVVYPAAWAPGGTPPEGGTVDAVDEVTGTVIENIFPVVNNSVGVAFWSTPSYFT
jgi:hypothetical protein